MITRFPHLRPNPKSKHVGRGPAALPRQRLYFDGRSYFAALLQEIESARESVDLETYIFDLDETGRRVIDALVRAARRGVRVRVLVDGVGAWRSVATLTRVFAASPVQFKVYRRLALRAAWFSLHTIRQLGHRNHRKTCLIDKRSAWIGSFNVSAVHTRGTARFPSWRDSAIRVEGGDFRALYEAFERAWGGPGRRPRPFPEQVRFLLNCTLRLRRKRNLAILRRLRATRRRLWVTTPYFAPDRRVLRALMDAARSGADVRLLLPKKPDVPGMDWINSVFFRRLDRSGLRIYFYSPSVLHAKTILGDDWAIVGSSNLNHRSWLHDLEVDTVVTDQDSLRELSDQFERDLRSSLKSPPATPASWRVRLTDQLALGIRYFI